MLVIVCCLYHQSSSLDSLFLTFLYHTHTHIYNMFGSRKTLVAVVALTLGALGVSAQTPTRDKYSKCGESLIVVGIEPVYYWEYDDPAFYNVTYTYDPTYCDSTIPVNFISVTDYLTGTSYACSKEQFAANRTTVHGQCVITQ